MHVQRRHSSDNRCRAGGVLTVNRAENVCRRVEGAGGLGDYEMEHLPSLHLRVEFANKVGVLGAKKRMPSTGSPVEEYSGGNELQE